MTATFDQAMNALIAYLRLQIGAPFISDPQIQIGVDWSVLNRGFDYFLIVYPSGFTNVLYATNIWRRIWTLRLECIVRHAGKRNVIGNALAFQMALLNAISAIQPNQLHPGMELESVSSNHEPQYYYADSPQKDTGPVFMGLLTTATIRDYFM